MQKKIRQSNLSGVFQQKTPRPYSVSFPEPKKHLVSSPSQISHIVCGTHPLSCTHLPTHWPTLCLGTSKGKTCGDCMHLFLSSGENLRHGTEGRQQIPDMEGSLKKKRVFIAHKGSGVERSQKCSTPAGMLTLNLYHQYLIACLIPP